MSELKQRARRRRRRKKRTLGLCHIPVQRKAGGGVSPLRTAGFSAALSCCGRIYRPLFQSREEKEEEEPCKFRIAEGPVRRWGMPQTPRR